MHTGCQYALQILKSDLTPCWDLILGKTLVSKCIAASHFQLNQICDNEKALTQV